MLAKALEVIFEQNGFIVNGKACVTEIEEQVGSLGLCGNCRLETELWRNDEKHKVMYYLSVSHVPDPLFPEQWDISININTIYLEDKWIWGIDLVES